MIETPRCTLRPLSESDFQGLTRLYTDPGVRAYLGGPVSEKEGLRRLVVLLGHGSRCPAWVLFRKDDGVVLGMVSLAPHHDGSDVEISYALLPEYQGFRYATEAVGAVITYVFNTLGLLRLVAETQAANEPSCRLLQRLGMSVHRKVMRFGAEQIVYSIGADMGHSGKRARLKV